MILLKYGVLKDIYKKSKVINALWWYKQKKKISNFLLASLGSNLSTW